MEYLLNLGEFAGGALQEKAEEAMRKVIGNMRDPNTPWKKTAADSDKNILCPERGQG